MDRSGLKFWGRAIHCPQDIPRVPGTSKPTWVRIADPNNPYTSLSKSSQQCLTWLASCFQRSPVQPLARPRQLQALASLPGTCRTYGQYGLSLSSLDSGTSHASRRWRSWHCCKLPTAILVVGTTRSACLQALTIRQRKQALTVHDLLAVATLRAVNSLLGSRAQRAAAANTLGR